MRLPGTLLLAACLAGCFTEVGNAEDERLVDAEFRVDYSPGALPKQATVQTAFIERFYLGVREAEFHLLDSTGTRMMDYHLWKEDSLVLPVDFTGSDPAASLPTQKVSDIDPENMRLECVLPAAKPLNADTMDLSRFADPAFIKGLVRNGIDSTPFLFALPSGKELNLVYPKTVIEGWYSQGRYRCQFIFYANKWIASANLSAAQTVKDKAGRKLILLDASHNPAAFAALTAAFSKAFNAPTVFLDQRP